MTEKRKTPYQHLLEAAREFYYSLPHGHKCHMFFWPKNRLRDGWTLHEVWERTQAADKLGFDVIVRADDDGLRMSYRKKLPDAPYEFKV